MPDAKTDPHRLPSVSGAEARQQAKAEFIPGGLLAAILVMIVVIALLAAYG